MKDKTIEGIANNSKKPLAIPKDRKHNQQNIRVESYSNANANRKNDSLPSSIMRHSKAPTKVIPIYPVINPNKYALGISNGKLFGFITRNLNSQYPDAHRQTAKRPYK